MLLIESQDFGEEFFRLEIGRVIPTSEITHKSFVLLCVLLVQLDFIMYHYFQRQPLTVERFGGCQDPYPGKKNSRPIFSPGLFTLSRDFVKGLGGMCISSHIYVGQELRKSGFLNIVYFTKLFPSMSFRVLGLQ